MPNTQHYGLYFTPAQLQQAQNNRDHEPFKSAWAFLERPDIPAPKTAATECFWNALHYRLNDQSNKGEQAVIALQNGVGLEPDENRLEALWSAVMVAQGFEMVRDHVGFQNTQSVWLNLFAQHVGQLHQITSADAGGIAFVETIWRGLLNIAAGVVLEDDARFEAGAAIYRDVIEHYVRPEGYLPRAVEGEDGGSLERQLLSVAGLVLMAEAAGQVGVDLWGYSSRGISVVTAASYCIYYYYYPEQWRWDTVVEAQSNALYQQHGGFLEIVNAHARPKDLKLMLESLRPFYNPFAGGLTTLTHAPPAKRRLFG